MNERQITAFKRDFDALLGSLDRYCRRPECAHMGGRGCDHKPWVVTSTRTIDTFTITIAFSAVVNGTAPYEQQEKNT